MSGNEGVEIFRRRKVVGIVVPSTHVGAGSGHPLALAKRLQQRVFIQMQKEVVIMVKLLAQQSIKQLHLGVLKYRQRWDNLHVNRSKTPG